MQRSEDIAQHGSRAVVQVWRAAPEAAEGRGVDPSECRSETLAGAGFQRPDIVQCGKGVAIREAIRRMTCSSIERFEQLAACDAIGRQSATGGAIRRAVCGG